MLLGMIDGEDIPSTTPLPDAIGMLDFVANTYNYDGSSYTVDQVVDHDEWRTANGLEIPGASVGAAILISALKTKLATCLFAMVIECEILNAASDYAILYTQSDAGEGYPFEFSYDQEWYATTNDGVPPHPFPEDLTHSKTNGIHKLAVNRSSGTNLALSVDGNAYVADSTSDTFPVEGFPHTLFTLGGYSTYSSDAVRIRTLSVYDPIDNNDLIRLSAL